MRKWSMLFALITVLFACNQKEEVKTPNILWIVAEDFSQDLGCYGHPLVHTPNLDALAERGTRFTHVFTTAPVCAPSRTALATGMYQTSINAHHMRYPDELKNELPSHVLPLNELMRKAGYQTAKITDGPGRTKEDWSFKSDVAKYDVLHWDELSSDKPFFGVVNLRLTHRAFERDTLRPIDPDRVSIPPYYPNHAVSREDWAAYLETAQVLDQEVGVVLGELQSRGLDRNTIVMFFADHGRPFTRGKNYHFDSGTRIPLIISCPEGYGWSTHLLPGSTNNNLISAIDITATSLAIAGMENPAHMQGRVFLGDQKEEDRKLIFCASDRIGETFFKTRSVRNNSFKYIRNFNRDFSINSSATAYRKEMHPIYHLLNILAEKNQLTPAQQALVDPMPEELLFDLQADPDEINDLSKDPEYATTLDEMRAELKAWQTRTVDHGMEADSPELTEAFRKYGIQSAGSRVEKIAAAEQLVRQKIEDETE